MTKRIFKYFISNSTSRVAVLKAPRNLLNSLTWKSVLHSNSSSKVVLIICFDGDFAEMIDFSIQTSNNINE